MKANRVLITVLVGLLTTPSAHGSENEHIDELEATVEEAIADSVATEEQSKTIRERRVVEKKELEVFRGKALAETAEARAKAKKSQKEITHAEWAIEAMQKAKQKLAADQRYEENQLKKKLAHLDQLKSKKDGLNSDIVLAEKNLNGTREQLEKTRRSVIETQDSTVKMIAKLEKVRVDQKEQSARLAHTQISYKQTLARLKILEGQQQRKLAQLQSERQLASVDLVKLQKELSVREQRTKALEAQTLAAKQRTQVVVAKLEQLKASRINTLRAMQNREILAQSNLKSYELREARARAEMSQLPTVLPAKTVVITRDCNVRTEPTAQARSLGVIRGGSKVAVARGVANEGNMSIWQKIELPSKQPAYAAKMCFQKTVKR